MHVSGVTLSIMMVVCLLFGAKRVLGAQTDTVLVVVGGSNGQVSTALRQLQARLAEFDAKKTIVLFTGNYSTQPLPRKTHELRQQIEGQIEAHIRAVERFHRRGGRVYFLVGHRDAPGGRKYPRRLRRFLNKRLQQSSGANDPTAKLDVMPHADCGEPTTIDLENAGVLALLNTQWWFQDWNKHPRTNEGCEFKTRSEFTFAFEEILRKNKGRRIIFALHHPLESLGPYGGHFEALQHLKPPLLGSLQVWAKQSGLVNQYRGHPKYVTLVSSLKGFVKKYGGFIFVSGHDQSLQLLRVGQQTQIISGSSGQTASTTAKPRSGEFAQSSIGWAELRLGPDGAASVQFKEAKSRNVLYQAKIPFSFAQQTRVLATESATITAKTTSSRYTKRNIGQTNVFEKIFLGEHYRDAYSLTLDFKNLDLSTEHGGLTPVKIGGGTETNSLRLLDKHGGQWVVRSTTKDSSRWRWLPYPLNEVGLLVRGLEDLFTATHPSAPLAVTPMAEAIGVYHTKPRLMYLPDQAALGDYRNIIKDEVVLIERRPKAPKYGRLPSNLASTSTVTKLKYRSTKQMIERFIRNPDKHHLDQEMMLRARLFDIFLGDWDRHEDQWRFVGEKQSESILYKPIARDRDQVFSHYDGLLMSLGQWVVPSINVYPRFDDNIGNIKWLIYNARFIDPILLNQLSRQKWIEIAKELQQKLTDDVIAKALSTWPKEAYDLHGQTIQSKLRKRREQLVMVAKQYYERIYKNAKVLGSDDDDIFVVRYLNDQSLQLQAYRVGKTVAKAPYFDQVYDAKYTREVRIYGLDGRDSLLILGRTHKNIIIRFVGGPDEDYVEGQSEALGVYAYDTPKGLIISPTIKVKDRRSGSYYKNQHDLHDIHHEPTTYSFLPEFSSNPDDDLYIGGSLDVTLTGFKRSPFASNHHLSTSFSSSTLGVKLGYNAYFPRFFGAIDQLAQIEATTPTYTRNFFGLTNTYVDPGTRGRLFYQVRQAQLYLGYGLAYRGFSDFVSYGLKGFGHLVDTEATKDRFVSESQDINADTLTQRYYIGTEFFAKIDTQDSNNYPKRGLFAKFTASINKDVSEFSPLGEFLRLDGTLGTHLAIDRAQRVILSSRMRLSTIFGRYPFYFAPTLGDLDLRAYNREQLAGNSVFAHTSDLRFELFKIRHSLPGVVGIAASIDHGRAFGPDTRGNDYHVMLGGKLFWSILDTFGLSVSYHQGLQNGQRFSFGLGTLFEQGESQL